MGTLIRELPTKEWLLEYYYENNGNIFWKEKTISKGRKSIRAHRRVNTWVDARGYYKVRLKGQTYTLSRIIYQIYYGNLTEDFEIDHIDRDKSNNRIDNLRAVPQEVNKRNKPKPRNNSSSNTGVAYCKKFHPGSSTKFSEYYVARWYDLNGKLHGKNFNIAKLGKQAAFEAAKQYRQKMIEELNTQGAGYSETHGVV